MTSQTRNLRGLTYMEYIDVGDAITTGLIKVMLFALLTVLGVGNRVAAQTSWLAVHGSPEFSSQSGGFLPGEIRNATSVNNAGVAVAWGEHFGAGGAFIASHGLYWDASGATILNLGPDGAGAVSGQAFAINNSGMLVGWAEVAAGLLPMRWQVPGNTPTQMQVLGADSGGRAGGRAFAINDGGIAGGDFAKYDGLGNFISSRPVRWDANGAVTELDLPAGLSSKNEGLVSAINLSGQAVGYGQKFDAAGNFLGFGAYRWDSDGPGVTELDPLGVDAQGKTRELFPIAISASGDAAGWGMKFDETGAQIGTRALRWDAGGSAVTELGILGPRGDNHDGFSNTFATDINSVGVIVGGSQKFTDAGQFLGNRPVMWHAGETTPRELDLLTANQDRVSFGTVNAINDLGFSVGAAWAGFDGEGNPITHAVLWSFDGSVTDLNSLIDPNSGWVLTEAEAISDSQWISGWGEFDPDGAGPVAAYLRFFLMQTNVQVPEPTAHVLVGFGLILILVCTLRRKQFAAEASVR